MDGMEWESEEEVKKVKTMRCDINTHIYTSKSNFTTKKKLKNSKTQKKL